MFQTTVISFLTPYSLLFSGLFLYCIVGEAKHASINFRPVGKISYIPEKAIPVRNKAINCERSGFLFSSIPQGSKCSPISPTLRRATGYHLWC